MKNIDIKICPQSKKYLAGSIMRKYLYILEIVTVKSGSRKSALSCFLHALFGGSSYDYGVETLPAMGWLARCDVSQKDFSVNNRK